MRTGGELLTHLRSAVGVVGVMFELAARSPRALHVDPNVDVRAAADVRLQHRPEDGPFRESAADVGGGDEVAEPIPEPTVTLAVESVAGIGARRLDDLQALGGDDLLSGLETIVKRGVE